MDYFDTGFAKGYSDAQEGRPRVWVLWYNKFFLDAEGNDRNRDNPYANGYHCGYETGLKDTQ